MKLTFEGRLLPYHNQKYFYLGKAGPKIQNGRRPFKGL